MSTQASQATDNTQPHAVGLHRRGVGSSIEFIKFFVNSIEDIRMFSSFTTGLRAKGVVMTSIGKMFGGRKAPNIVRRDQLGALVQQVRLHATEPRPNSDKRRSIAATPEKAWKIFSPVQGRNGDWKIEGCLQGRVGSDSPTRWTAATNAGAWVHAAAGWWRTQEEAWDALEKAIQFAYADIFAAEDAEKARQAAGAALREEFRARLEALEVRRQAAGRVGYPLSMYIDGFSYGGHTKPYTEEAVAAFEAEIVAAETRRDEKAMFDAAAPAFVERLVALGEQAEMFYGGVRIVVGTHWQTLATPTAEGLKKLETFVLDQERHHRAPVEVKDLDLSGLFGGAAKVKR